ncbi:MAG TPA: PPC domain-containing protein, partial [Methylomirabilota bacterium]|nr:PPC domain-containing protein [Methylomirabilota bacterium]
TIRIAPDCGFGEHQLRVRTAGGVSELRTFWVGAYTNISEFEPNNEIAKAHQVSFGITINGSAGGEDTDFFRVTARKGQRISAEVEAIRLGRAMLDAFLAIRDSDGNVLASADDTTLLMQDSFVSVLAPRDGAYYLEMRDGTYSGNGSAYRLHLGNFARPTMVFPLGGQAGEKVLFNFLGGAGGDFTQEIQLPADVDSKHGLFAKQDGEIAPSPNWIRVSAFGNELESEPNHSKEAATAFYGALPIAFNGIISKTGDEDWFRFTAKKGQALDINVYARRLRSPLDSSIELRDSKGNRIDGNDDAGGPDSALKFNPPADGEYLLKIRDQFEQGGPEFAYRIEVAPQQPGVVMSIPQVARNDSQSRQFIAVPRGGRFATMMSAKRANFVGDLDYQLGNLPAGVKLIADTLPAKQELEPLVFEAASDAPISGRFVELTAVPTDTGKSVQSSFQHNVEFISGPNNTYYYSTREEKLYVAVCESAPFSIRIEEPKAPLVAFGALELKIVAERRGYDGPINVKMMWNPPGVGSLPDITIPKGSNSAVYQLNAKGDVELRKWKIAVLGSNTSGERNADRTGSATFVSSQLATLETAEPFVVGTVAPIIVSPGQEAKLVCKLDQRKPFEGKARVHVLGLPEKITASEAHIMSTDKEVVIKLTVDSTIALGSYRNFLCSADVVHNEQIIPHNLAAGAVIRVVPPKKGDATKKVAAK